MTITVTNYITDYWILDNIIDCSEIVEEKLNSNHEYILSENNSSPLNRKLDNREQQPDRVNHFDINKKSTSSKNTLDVKRHILPHNSRRIQEYKKNTKNTRKKC